MPITDEDVLRELLDRATEDLRAPSAITAGIVARHRRRLRSTRILSITTTSVAAAAVLATVVVPRVGPSARGHAQPPTALPSTGLPAVKLPPIKLTAVQVLDQLSVAAADTPQPTGRYIALTEMDLYPDIGYPANFLGDFLNPKLSPLGKEQLQQMVMEYGVERTNVFDAVTGDVWAYQRGSEVPSAAPVTAHWSPTRAEFATWPTDPAKLRALLVRQAGQTVGLDIVGVKLTADDLVFEEATTWLWNPLLSPALRSAMYKVLAVTPGVTVKTGTTDTAAGRPSRSAGTTASLAWNPPSKARARAPCSNRTSPMSAPPCTRPSPATPPLPPTPTAADALPVNPTGG